MKNKKHIILEDDVILPSAVNIENDNDDEPITFDQNIKIPDDAKIDGRKQGEEENKKEESSEENKKEESSEENKKEESSEENKKEESSEENKKEESSEENNQHDVGEIENSLTDIGYKKNSEGIYEKTLKTKNGKEYLVKINLNSTKSINAESKLYKVIQNIILETKGGLPSTIEITDIKNNKTKTIKAGLIPDKVAIKNTIRQAIHDNFVRVRSGKKDSQLAKSIFEKLDDKEFKELSFWILNNKEN